MYRKLFSFFFIFILLSFQVYANTGDIFSSNQSIKDLHENIKDLSLEKKNIQSKWESFISENGKIISFIREDLSQEERTEIEALIVAHYEKQDAYNIKEKIHLYRLLVPYVKTAQLRNYIAYIKESVDSSQADESIDSEILRKKEILDQKISFIKERIEENNKQIDIKIQHIVEERINQKIASILANKKFQILSLEQRKEIFTITLKKIEEKRSILLSIQDKTSILEKKIHVYTIVESRLQETIHTLK